MNDEKPSWGKTIGAFFLCGCVTIGTCILMSAAIASNMGYSGYSRGGLLASLSAIACAAYYRSTGKLGSAVGIAVVIGVVLGVLAVAMANLIMGR